MTAGVPAADVPDVEQPTERIELLLRDLRASPGGLTEREAQRRLVVHGPNELERRGGRRWPHELAAQLTHPLALLLWVAAALAWIAGIVPIAIAIVLVILLNAAFAFVQERQAERAVEALAAFLPPHATVLRDGRRRSIEARGLVPGDVAGRRGGRRGLRRRPDPGGRGRGRPLDAHGRVAAAVPVGRGRRGRRPGPGRP